MRYTISALLLLSLFTPSLAMAQDSHPSRAKPDKVLEPLLPLPELLPDSGPLQPQEALSRRISAYTALGAGIPIFFLGLSGLLDAHQERQDPRKRNKLARGAGSAMVAGAGMAVMGASMLRAEGQRKKQRAREERRSKILAAPPMGFDPLLMSLEKDAESAREARDTTGTLIMVTGVLAGGVLGALPFASESVDRTTFVSAGAALIAAGVGGGLWHWWTPSPEEELYKQALRP